MQILKVVNFRLGRDETEGATFDRVLNVLKNTGYDPSKVRFMLEDSPSGLAKVSSTDRVIKAYPTLAPFRCAFICKWDNNQQVVALSNLGPEWRDANPSPPNTTVPISILSEIFHGIPRRFPFWNATVVFDNVEALNLAGLPATTVRGAFMPGHPAFPGIHLQSSWSRSRRMPSLNAAISLPVPERDEMGALSAAAQQLISLLGKTAYTQLTISPDEIDRPRVDALVGKAKGIAERYEIDPFAGSPGARLPQELPVIGASESFGVSLIERQEAGIPSVKELLKQEFQPLEYRYKSNLSGRGCYTLRKRGRQNYVLGVFVDVSPWAGQICSIFSVTTIHATITARIRLPPHGYDYPVNEQLSMVVKNMVFVVRTLEETFVRELEALFGPSPGWFADMELKP